MALLLSTKQATRFDSGFPRKIVEMFYAQKATPMPGRLLVEVIQSDGTDDTLGIILPHAPADTVMAKIIRSSDEEKFPSGSVVMYDRLHGKEITLLDDAGDPVKYKVIQTVDISLILSDD